MLLAIALAICVFTVGGFFLELRSEGHRVFKSLRFWCGVLACFASFLFFYIANSQQRKDDIEKGVAAQKQAGEIQSIRRTSEEIKEHDKLEFENQTLRQKAQLEEAKNLVKAQEEQKDSLKKVIAAQALNVRLLNTLSLDHDLTGIQISFSPSQDQWARIATAYSKIQSPHRDMAYVDVPMMAERVGDHWQLYFEALYIKPYVLNTQQGPLTMGGYKRFLTISTANKLFEVVLNEAAFGLRVEWGNGTSTAVDPTGGYYPSAVYVSRNRIAIILRPPLVSWNLNDLKRNPEVTFYGRDHRGPLPESFTLCSLDPGVALNQTIQLNWRERTEESYDARMHRQSSGPHRLRVDLKFFGPSSVNTYTRQCAIQTAKRGY